MSQEHSFQNTSVIQNISFGCPNTSLEGLKTTAKMAQAHDFIGSLSDITTLIGEEGELLSGGQRQRLSIARALLCDSEIIIFDEATSQMDALTEEAMRVLIDNFHRKKTIISIARRLSTIINADKILSFLMEISCSLTSIKF